MTSQLVRREHAIARAQHERDALLQVIADADMTPALRQALEHRTHALHDAAHELATMSEDEPVYPTVMSKVEGT